MYFNAWKISVSDTHDAWSKRWLLSLRPTHFGNYNFEIPVFGNALFEYVFVLWFFGQCTANITTENILFVLCLHCKFVVHLDFVNGNTTSAATWHPNDLSLSKTCVHNGCRHCPMLKSSLKGQSNRNCSIMFTKCLILPTFCMLTVHMKLFQLIESLSLNTFKNICFLKNMFGADTFPAQQISQKHHLPMKYQCFWNPGIPILVSNMHMPLTRQVFFFHVPTGFKKSGVAIWQSVSYYDNGFGIALCQCNTSRQFWVAWYRCNPFTICGVQSSVLNPNPPSRHMLSCKWKLKSCGVYDYCTPPGLAQCMCVSF